jgi:hypothetical protein
MDKLGKHFIAEQTEGGSMRFHMRALSLLALAVCLTASARADRVPSHKVLVIPSNGARTDYTVPYGTNGRSTLGVYDGVAPKVYSSPIVNDPANPGARPVYNLPFFGAVQAFGDRSNGAVQREGPPQSYHR